LVRKIREGIFLRLFFNSKHRIVGHSLYVDDKILPPLDGPELDRLYVNLFRSLSPVNIAQE
jgi:hypothetical protein